MKFFQKPFPLVFLRKASSFQHLLIIITNKSISVWFSLVKWATTGDSFMRPWVILKRWLLIRQWRGFPVFPTYQRPHVLPCTRSVMLDVWQEASSFNLKHSPVTLLVKMSVVIHMGQVLHLLASQRKFPGDHLCWEI